MTLTGHETHGFAFTTAIAVLAAVTAVAAVPPGEARAMVDGPQEGPGSAGFVPGELLVRFKPAVDGSDRAEVRAEEDVDFQESLPLPGLQKVETESGTSVPEAVRELEDRPEVAYAQPNFVREVALSPDGRETLFPQLWGLENSGQPVAASSGGGFIAGTAGADIDAEAAWDSTTGRSPVTVAVVDSGVDSGHQDLAGNMWASGDKPKPGDDDGNGFADDARGWDFCGPTLPDGYCSGRDDNDPSDRNGHGTHVAGTIGADGTNHTGMAGVAWDVGLMPVRVASAEGRTTDALLAQGFGYAARNGAQVVNASFAAKGPAASPALRDVVTRSQHVVFAVAAGNGTNNDGRRVNNDRSPDFLCNIPAPNLVCVTASDQFDRLASFANYGVRSVDLAAPGTNVLSTTPSASNDDYRSMSGTSMATPHVAGTAALTLALTPNLVPTEIKCALMAGVDRIPNPFALATAAGGRLDAARTLSLVAVSGAPAACVTAAPPPRTRDDTPTFRFEGSQPGATFDCRIDGGDVFACGSKLTRELGDGHHILDVRARSAGGVAGWDDEHRVGSKRFLVDTTGPRMGMPGGTLDLTRRGIPVTVACPSAELSGPCAGGVRLRTVNRLNMGGRKRRVTLGTARFSVRPGRSATPVVRVSREARKAVTRAGTMWVTARARAADSLGNEAVASKRFLLSD